LEYTHGGEKRDRRLCACALEAAIVENSAAVSGGGRFRNDRVQDLTVRCGAVRGVAVRRRGGGVVLCRLFSYTVVRELTDDLGERRVAVALVVGNREKLLRGKETEKKKINK